MPEIENEVTFTIPVLNLYFATQVNGDKLVISSIELSREQASSLAWLVNTKPETTELEVNIKVK